MASTVSREHLRPQLAADDRDGALLDVRAGMSVRACLA